MANKIIGYLLLLLGLVIILSSLYGTYEMFTGKINAPEIFKVPAKEIPTPDTNPRDLQKQMEETIRKQIAELFPIETIYKLLNLISWSIFAGVLIIGGGQISGIGTKLVMPRSNP
ncbi:MAG: hypothetical protein WC845_01420 [Candidatus Staskawiczbacteria bacterium]